MDRSNDYIASILKYCETIGQIQDKLARVLSGFSCPKNPDVERFLKKIDCRIRCGFGSKVVN